MYNVWFSYLWYVDRHFSYIKFMEIEKDKKHFDNYITAWIIIICLLFCAIIFFIFIPRVSALEERSFQYGSNGKFGYKIPDRVANNDNETSNYLNLVIQSGDTLEIDDNFKILNRYCNEQVQGNCAYVGTDTIIYNKTNSSRDTKLTFGYHPANNTDNLDDMLINGTSFYYNGDYSYQFELEIWSDKTLGISNNLTIGRAYYVNGTYNWTYTFNNYELLENKTINGMNYRRYLIRIGFDGDTPHYQNSKFLKIPLSPDMNNVFAETGAIRPQEVNVQTNFGIQGTGTIYYVFSRPTNIIYWSDSSSLTCSTSCWTDEDTYNSDEWGPTKQLEYNKSFFEYAFFRDYGLGGVFTSFFQKIRYYFDYYDPNSCHNLNINILNQQVQIPCGKTFWGRNDVSYIAYLWELFWSGFVAFFVARKIYSNLMDLFDDDFNFKEVIDL